MAKQTVLKPAFTLPTTGTAAEGRLQVLGRIMAANQPLVVQLEALLSAKDAYRAAEAEANAINTALSEIRKGDFAAAVRDIRVLSIRQSNPQDESPIASLTIHYEYRGVEATVPLFGAERHVHQAAIESGKLPVRVLALATNPAEAFARWHRGRSKGYLVG
ncbi:hypothetical protein [Paraburkholderia sp. DGU8]|uniref:hypothetical protein n=1 Tax=Paraburkholderia sp. DGU8 TaxID=3161997 RepID=UPI0034663F72